MRKHFLVLMLTVFVCGMQLIPAGEAQAVMLGRVDGQKVYYSAEKAYLVDSSFVYIGSYTSDRNASATNTLKQTSLVVLNEVFAKKHNDTNEIVAIFIAQWQKLPTKWRVGAPGPIPEKLYDFKPTKFTGLAEFLAAKGYTFPAVFYGGMLLGYGYAETYTKYYFAVADSILPPGVNKQEHVRSAFNSAIVPAP